MVTHVEMLKVLQMRAPQVMAELQRPEMAMLLVSDPLAASKLFEKYGVPPPSTDALPHEMYQFDMTTQKAQQQGGFWAAFLTKARDVMKRDTTTPPPLAAGIHIRPTADTSNTMPPPNPGPPASTVMGRPNVLVQKSPIEGGYKQLGALLPTPTAVAEDRTVNPAPAPWTGGPNDIQTLFDTSTPKTGETPWTGGPNNIQELFPPEAPTTGQPQTGVDPRLVALMSALGSVQAPPAPQVDIPRAPALPARTPIQGGNVASLVSRQAAADPRVAALLRLRQAIGG